MVKVKSMRRSIGDIRWSVLHHAVSLWSFLWCQERGVVRQGFTAGGSHVSLVGQALRASLTASAVRLSLSAAALTPRRRRRRGMPPRGEKYLAGACESTMLLFCGNHA